MNRTSLITLSILVGIVLLGALYILTLDESEKQKQNETPAAKALLIENEEASYLDMSQNKIDLGSEFGNVIVVSSWASWCPQCAEDIGKLDQVASEFQGREVSFLAINRAENPYTAERFLSTVAKPNNIRIILDPTDHFFTTNTGYAMPETIVYSQDGQVLSHQRGNLNQEDLKKALEKALE